MRKRKYRLHYGDYAPEENERLYMDMSKKGWPSAAYFSAALYGLNRRIFCIELIFPLPMYSETLLCLENKSPSTKNAGCIL
mgnify:CR=1 FL=1